MHPLRQIPTECFPSAVLAVPFRRGGSIRDVSLTLVFYGLLVFNVPRKTNLLTLRVSIFGYLQVPRGHTVPTIAKSKRISFPPTEGSSSNSKKATTQHQIRRPPFKSSGNIAPLEREKPSTTENDTQHSQGGSLHSIELENHQELKTIGVPTSAPPPPPFTNRSTRVMKLNAVPLKMLSPVLSKNAFQQEQQQLRQQQQQPLLSPFPDSDARTQIFELIVGRLAFCGLFGTLLVFVFTGQTLPQQIQAYPDNIFLVTIAVLSASFALVKEKTRTVGGNNSGIQVQFLPALSSIDIEKWIGRVAMLGFGSLLAWQLLSSSSS
jgi:hypothetical protein